MEQAQCWERILELISQLVRIQSAACEQNSQAKILEKFAGKDNLPNLLKIHPPIGIVSFPLNNLLYSKMSDNSMIVNHHETCLIRPLAICDTFLNTLYSWYVTSSKW